MLAKEVRRRGLVALRQLAAVPVAVLSSFMPVRGVAVAAAAAQAKPVAQNPPQHGGPLCTSA
jgi:hypothetical protein